MSASRSIGDLIGQAGFDDMTLLSSVTVERIRDNLQKRFQAGIIYTTIGDVLVSVNPQKPLPIYGEGVQQAYSSTSLLELPPHVFSVAQAAIAGLRATRDPQCIVVTGESGAGKSYAARFLLGYVADTCSAQAPDAARDAVRRLCDTVVAATPLLEAFGNAKTKHNDNSSRFSHLTELCFDPASFQPVGAKITHFLLEKTRVVSRAKGERSFHAFYQLCKGAPDAWRREFEIGPAASFLLLAASANESISVAGDVVDDAAGFQATWKAMETLGFDEKERKGVARILAAILWLGNVRYFDSSNSGSPAVVEDRKPLQLSAKLLGVNEQWLEQLTVMRQMETTHGAAAPTRGTKYLIPLNAAKASSSRDSLVKALYGALFDWLVLRANAALHFVDARPTLSVLDVGGFEVFEQNRFEQLCVNYINETMQQLFVEFTLRREQEIYMSEGIPWRPIQYFDNKQACEAIDGKRPPGVLAILDDVSRAVHAQAEQGEADAAFERALQSSPLAKGQYLRCRGNSFALLHYAGLVEYTPRGMAASNVDTLQIGHIMLLMSSSEDAVKMLFPAGSAVNAALADAEAGKIPATTSQRFRDSAQQMVRAISACTPHYIRCLRPSRKTKDPKVFDTDAVQDQIRCLGLVDNVQIKRAACAHKMTFERFLGRFFLASPQTSRAGKPTWMESGGDLRELVKAILCVRLGLKEGFNFEFGKTLVFIRSPETIHELEQACAGYSHAMARRIVQSLRACKEARQHAALFLQRSYRSWRNNMSPALRLRTDIEAALLNRKERKRLSVTSLRQFFGDYLNLMSVPMLRAALSPAIAQQSSGESVVFSYRCSDVIAGRGLRHELRLRPRVLALTTKALFLLKIIREKGSTAAVACKLKDRVPLAEISWISMSSLADGFVVVTLGDSSSSSGEGRSVVLMCDLNTELVARIRSLCPRPLQLGFSNKLEFRLKKGGPRLKLQFVKAAATATASAGGGAGAVDLSAFGKGIVTVAPGLPPSTSAVLTQRKFVRRESSPSPSPSPSPHRPSSASTTKASPATATAAEASPARTLPTKPHTVPAEVVCAHRARQGDEVSISPGDTVLVFPDAHLGDWSLAFVASSGRAGLVPSHCLRPRI